MSFFLYLWLLLPVLLFSCRLQLSGVTYFFILKNFLSSVTPQEYMLKLVSARPSSQLGFIYLMIIFTVIAEWRFRRDGRRWGWGKVCRGQFLEYLGFCAVEFEPHSCGDKPLEFLCRVLAPCLSPEERTLKDWILNAFLAMAGSKKKVNLPFSLKFLFLCAFGQLKDVYIQVATTPLQAQNIYSFIVCQMEPWSWLKFVKQQFENHCHWMNRLLTVCVCGNRCVLKLK